MLNSALRARRLASDRRRRCMRSLASVLPDIVYLSLVCLVILVAVHAFVVLEFNAAAIFLYTFMKFADRMLDKFPRRRLRPKPSPHSSLSATS